MHTVSGATSATVPSVSKSLRASSPPRGKRPKGKHSFLHGAVCAAAFLPALAVAVPTYTAVDLGSLGGTTSLGLVVRFNNKHEDSAILT